MFNFVYRRKGVMILCLLALLQCALRIAIPASALTGPGPEFENPVTEEVMLFIHVMFIAIGTIGLAATYGLWAGRRWGYTGTIGISLLTIVFDIWAIAFIQASAVLGMVLPLVFMAYLLSIRSDFALEAWNNESARGIRN